MDPATSAALIGAGGSLLGGMLGSSSAKKAAKINYQINQDNIAMQYDFAKNGILWKTQDAKQAGIHPVYALGAPTFNPSVSSIGATPDNSMANAMSDIGQNVSRAVAATQTPEQKAATALTLENQKLQNDMLKVQISNSVAKQPAIPRPAANPLISGQGDASVFDGVSLSRNPDGSLDVVPSEAYSNANQNFISGVVPELKHFFRNQLMAPFTLPKNIDVKGKSYTRSGSTYWPSKKPYTVEVRPYHKKKGGY